MFNKKEVSFGTIVGVFGSILIALGFAWLIAQNWHQIPSALKIIILLGATSGAYFAGTIMRARDYSGIGKALLVLGSLLYTLSIFLIAQIFSTITSWQGQAWLLLLAWIGVLASAYIFDSSTSLVVGLIEFCVWLVIQFLAFAEKARYYDTSYGILALYFLAAGVLVYGLALLHRSAEHKFGRLYLIWTAFYFMAFTYVLSFQTLLPFLWSESLKFSSAIVFLLMFSAVAVIALVFGIITSLNRQAVQSKEVIGVFALIVLLILLISSASAVSTSIGNCEQKQCYDFKYQATCTNQIPSNNLQTKCQWINNYCANSYQDCYQYNKDENACTQKNCKWTPVTRCEQRTCNRYIAQGACEASSGCKWIGKEPYYIEKEYKAPYCIEKESCSQFNTQTACEGVQNLNCEWLTTVGCDHIGGKEICNQYKTQDECMNVENLGCQWLKHNHCSAVRQYCDNYRTQNSCEKSNCEWLNTGQCDAQSNAYPQTTACYIFRDASSCGTAKGCQWNEYSNYCDVERPCQKYSNNKDGCKQQMECQWRQGYSSYFGRRGKAPLSLWAIWIFANLIFILLILGVIGYGTWQSITEMINLGIVFFSLDILTRYIGFAMDFWGYTSLSIIFIAGGITLLIGGYFIEKWRRKLVAQVRSKEIPQKATRSR